MLSQRRFGVEIECGYPGGTPSIVALLDKEKIKPLSVGYDGSGCEVRSPPLKGTEGLKWLKECMQAIRDNGGYVTTADGLHVHHEGLPGLRLVPRGTLNSIAILRLIHSWKNNNKLLDKFVAERRRNNESYCAKVWQDRKNVKKAETGEYPGKYSDLNLRPLHSSKGTIEIRVHEGTLDFDEAEAWIRLCQSLIDKAVSGEKPIPKQKNHETLLDLLIDSDDVKAWLLEKAKRDGEPSLNSGFKRT